MVTEAALVARILNFDSRTPSAEETISRSMMPVTTRNAQRQEGLQPQPAAPAVAKGNLKQRPPKPRSQRKICSASMTTSPPRRPSRPMDRLLLLDQPSRPWTTWEPTMTLMTFNLRPLQQQHRPVQILWPPCLPDQPRPSQHHLPSLPLHNPLLHLQCTRFFQLHRQRPQRPRLWLPRLHRSPLPPRNRSLCNQPAASSRLAPTTSPRYGPISIPPLQDSRRRFRLDQRRARPRRPHTHPARVWLR